MKNSVENLKMTLKKPRNQSKKTDMKQDKKD